MTTLAGRPGQSRRWTMIMSGLLLAIILFALSPLISVLISSWIASANDCVLNEGGVNSCWIGGVDYGATLATMLVAGWFMFMTMPAGLVAFLIWLLVVIVGLVMRRRRMRGMQ